MAHRFIAHQIETLTLARDLVPVLPRIIRTASRLAQYADFERNAWGAVRAATAYWLWCGSDDIFTDYNARVRDSLRMYFANGDTAYFEPNV